MVLCLNYFDIIYIIVAEFEFSQPSYNVSEDSVAVSVCLELVSGILTEDVVIGVTIAANTEQFSGCAFSNKYSNLEILLIMDS